MAVPHISAACATQPRTGTVRRHAPTQRIGARKNLYDFFTDLDDLRRTCLRVTLNLMPFGPGVDRVVVIYVAQEKALARLVDDKPQIAIDAHRPEVVVFGRTDGMKLHARPRRIHLQVERGRLDRLLFLIC